MSTEDIPKGAQWLTVLNEKLADTRFCIVCMTPENLDAAWLNFEAGAIAHAIGETRVCPLLIGLKNTDVQPPMAIFQMAGITEIDIWKVVQSINDQCEQKLGGEQLRKSFDRWWPDLSDGIKDALATQSEQQAVHRDSAELLQETLLEVREQGRLLSQISAKLFPKEVKFAVPRVRARGPLSAGSVVMHEKWGRGEVASTVGDGNDQVLIIEFDDVGTKMLMLKYAPLTLMGDPPKQKSEKRTEGDEEGEPGVED